MEKKNNTKQQSLDSPFEKAEKIIQKKKEITEKQNPFKKKSPPPKKKGKKYKPELGNIDDFGITFSENKQKEPKLPTNPDAEVICITWPLFCSRIASAAARVQRKGPRRFTAITSSKSSW